MVLVHVALLALYDLESKPGLTVALIALAFVAWGWAMWGAETWTSGSRVLSVAILLRLLLIPLPPTLSDDTLRYVWDGRVASAGFNPYLLPPESEELAELRDELWQQMPHKQVPTVYPPLALAVFTLASWLPQPLVAVKILLCSAELVGCLLLIRLARLLGLPAGRIGWYAWNPLVVLEAAGMGHVDALLVMAMSATVLLLTRSPRRPALAAAAAVAGVLGKLLPLIALPMWARQSGRPWLFSLVAGGLLLAAFGPVLFSVGGAPPGLVTYGVSWEFNGALYEPLWRAIDAVDAVPRIKGGLDQLKQWVGHHEQINRLYHYVYPQFLAKLLLLGVLALFVLASLFDRDPILGTGKLFAGLMLVMATLYPWYLLSLMPWAAFCRHRAWLALSALVQLAYVPQLFGLDHWPLWYWLCWGPFFLLLLRSRWHRRRRPGEEPVACSPV